MWVGQVSRAGQSREVDPLYERAGWSNLER